MEDKKLKIDKAKLTPEQRKQLEDYEQAQTQLRVLQDIADMTQELLSVIDDYKKEGGKVSNGMGALLADMRDSLTALKDKEAPEAPDYSAPVVKAVDQLGTALSKAIKEIDVKPNVNLPAPEVTVPVDMSGVEAAVAEIPKAFAEAIKLIPKVEIPKTDNSDLLRAWEGISEQLVSLENATRMKPLPGSMVISNMSEATNELEKIRGFDIPPFTDIELTYVGSGDGLGEIETVVYKDGNVPVATLTLGYNTDDKLSSVGISY